MSLQEIFTEKVSGWEEGIIAAVFLNGVSPEELSLEPETKRRVALYLGILATLPWAYAKEICYAIAGRSNAED